MNATGNTTVIGELYSARGTRISYNQAGEMVLIEGRAPAYVRLEHQPRPGSKPNVIVAETIKYYLKTNTYNVENLKEGSIRHGGR
jgi:lipopolysaccharide export system protein LptA